MPKRLKPKKICEACRLHFYGDSLTDIAVLLDVAKTTLTRWRKTDIWQDYEAKLLDEWHQQQHAEANTSSEQITMNKLTENLDHETEVETIK